MKAAAFDFDTSVLGQQSKVECSIQSILRSSPSKWRLYPYSTLATGNLILVVAFNCWMSFLWALAHACSVVWTGRSQPIPKSSNKNLLFGFNAQSTYRVKLLNCSTATGGVLALSLWCFGSCLSLSSPTNPFVLKMKTIFCANFCLLYDVVHAFPETLRTAPAYFETRFSDDRDIEMLGTFVAFRPLSNSPVCETAMSFEPHVKAFGSGWCGYRLIISCAHQMSNWWNVVGQ